jgi:hypothetical protein
MDVFWWSNADRLLNQFRAPGVVAGVEHVAG